MNCASNIITANFSGGKTSATTAALWQWDYGQVLCITGIDLPAAFEVHFSTNRTGGVSTVTVGADGQVTIPNVLLTIGKNLNAWIYLSDSEGDGETEYAITIPVKARPMPETYDAEATGVFDDVVRQVSEYAQTAQTAADNAGASATAAAGSASAAAASASSAAESAGAAEQARADAVTAKGQAETAAQTATEKAQQSAQNASQAASDAGRAESAAERAETAETGAGAAKTAAEAAAQGAAASASAASASATSAGQSASAAAQSASAAAQSAASIDGDVQIASQKASEAQTAAGQAVTAKDAAVTAQTAAETAATNAGQSASTATTKAAEAAQSASGAAQSKTDAEAAAARAEQAAATLTVDTALSDTSTNPVQNKVITGELTDVKSAIVSAEDLTATTKSERISSWHNGLIYQAQTVQTNAAFAYSDTFAIDGQRIVFDASKYRILFVYYNDANNDPTVDVRAGISSWMTESPATIPTTSYKYMRIQVNTLNSGAIDTGNLTLHQLKTAKTLLVENVEQIGYESIKVGDDLHGYYEGTVGSTITYTAQATSHAFQIDLSAYIGKLVHVSYTTTNTTSTRCTALCDANGVISARITENAFGEGFYCYPDAVNHILYISYSSVGSSLSVSALNGMSENLYKLQQTSGKTVYVDASVASDGDGSQNRPYKTIQAAINAGGSIIRAKAGDYGAFIAKGKNVIDIGLWEMPTFALGSTPWDVPKIKIVGAITYGIEIADCITVRLSDIWVDSAPRYGIWVHDVEHVDVTRCYANSNSTTGFSLFRFDNVNGVIRECVAWESSLDGFNIHGYGNTEFINCVAYNCGDDGISHHDGCTGLILGGEYYGNGKGGVSSPTFGASVDISGVYSHDNAYGVYADGGDSTVYPIPVKARISNCVLKGNRRADIYTKNSVLVGWNNIYDTKTISEDGGSFTEFL